MVSSFSVAILAQASYVCKTMRSNADELNQRWPRELLAEARKASAAVSLVCHYPSPSRNKTLFLEKLRHVLVHTALC